METAANHADLRTVGALTPNEISQNVNTIQVITGAAPRLSGNRQHIVGYVATQHAPMTLGKPITSSLVRLIHHYCLHIEAAISARAGEFNPGGGSNWLRRNRRYPECSLAYISAL